MTGVVRRETEGRGDGDILVVVYGDDVLPCVVEVFFRVEAVVGVVRVVATGKGE
jgi:hypothetical protein